MTDFFVYLLLSLPLIGAYAMLAIGIVVVFRASKVLNLAHGAMAMLPAYATFELNTRGVPMLFAVVLGIAVGAGLGALVERFFVRPLAGQGPTAQTVGTVAVYGLVVAGVAQVWGSGSKRAPTVFPDGGIHVAGALLRWGQLGLFFVALLCAAGFFALFRYTGIGLAMRGAAENQRAAGLMGINPERMARLAWMLGGGLAALAGILLAAVTNLQPYSLSLQMLPAFVAALLGGLTSLPAAVAGAFVVGAAQGMVPAFRLVPGLRGAAIQVGMPQLVLTVIALATMYFRGVRFAAGDARAALAGGDLDSPRQSTFDDSLVRAPHGLRRGVRYALLVMLLAWPFVGIPTFLRPLDTFSVLGDAILACEYFLVASSIVLLTGWVGQISLSQGAFVGVSAFGSALLTRHFGIDFPYSLLPAALLAAGASALLGVVALRVRRHYLAVATLIFAWMADEYLFVVPWFAGRGGTATVETEPVGVAGGFPFFDFRERRTFYFVVLTAAAAVLFGLLNMRDSKTGRAFAAVRGSETAAASLGIDVVRYKLVAFATAGFIAGIGGNLIISHHVTVVPAQFSLQASLLFLAIAVVGGLRSLGGVAAAAVVFAALSEVFFRVPALGEYLQLVSALLLAVILLVYPGGLAAVPGTVRRLVARAQQTPTGASVVRRLERARPMVERVRAAAVRWLREGAKALEANRRRLPALPPSLARLLPRRRRRTEARRTALVLPTGRFAVGAPEVASNGSVPLASTNGHGHADERSRLLAELAVEPSFTADGVVLEAEGITVRFGGLTAVQDASLQVRAGQIVGLIGPNGAGKTTLFNAVSGLNSPTAGVVRLFGEDVTELPVHERAARGLGRTFQVIQLFPELTVFENLLVATHLHNPATLLSNVFVTGKAVQAELAAEETCRRVVHFLGLEDIADRPVAGLPFGTLRMVEIGRALVTGAPAVMLDEPASGLDNSETDRLSELLLFVRERLGVSILLIEHDVRMVTAVSDYMYVLNRGRMLAQGPPSEMQRDPRVVGAYLGEPVKTEVPA